MQILPSTLLALIAIGVFLAQGPRRGLWAFFLIAPFGAAATPRIGQRPSVSFLGLPAKR